MTIVVARNWWALALRGGLGVLFGIAAFFLPALAVAVLVALFGVYALIDGAFAIVAAARAAERKERWGAMLLEGLVGVAAGVVTFVWPLVTAVALFSVIAAWAIVTGVLEIAAAARLRRVIHDEWLLGLNGVVSIAFGVLLLVAPLAGVLAVVWWIGVYAVFHGIMLLALAMRLHDFGRVTTIPTRTTRAA
jgi:uncharacterized membrane protein HdeD (DUF308 family)